jgi:hypothetical protein
VDGLGQAAGHDSDHGPQDHRFAAGREAFVVAGGAAADLGKPVMAGIRAIYQTLT